VLCGDVVPDFSTDHYLHWNRIGPANDKLLHYSRSK